MPAECFVGTSCWLAILNKDDQSHVAAQTEYTNLTRSGIRLTTGTAVLNETANSLSDPRSRRSAVALYRRLQASDHVEVVFVDRRLWDEGWALYAQRPDKAWSLTDCISIVIMEERGVAEALTTDSHFDQAGLRALLRARS